MLKMYVKTNQKWSDNPKRKFSRKRKTQLRGT